MAGRVVNLEKARELLTTMLKLVQEPSIISDRFSAGATQYALQCVLVSSFSDETERLAIEGLSLFYEDVWVLETNRTHLTEILKNLLAAIPS